MTVDIGPNVGLTDLVAPIRKDPEFISWTNPIPPEWFSATKKSYVLVDQEALYGSLVWARTYGRTASETLSAPTDVANVMGFGFTRSNTDIIGIPIEAAVSTRAFIRNGVELVIPAAESATRITGFARLIRRMAEDMP